MTSKQASGLNIVETRKFAMVFPRCLVVGAGGFEFGHKAAEVDTLAIGIDIAIPEFSAVMVIAMEDAFVF